MSVSSTKKLIGRYKLVYYNYCIMNYVNMFELCKICFYDKQPLEDLTMLECGSK